MSNSWRNLVQSSAHNSLRMRTQAECKARLLSWREIRDSSLPSVAAAANTSKFLSVPRVRKARRRSFASAKFARRAIRTLHRLASGLTTPLKPSPNGVARRAASAGPAAHFALAARRATPLVPA